MSLPTATTLGDLRDEVLVRLGDTSATPQANRVWSESEVEGYLQDGVRLLAIGTKLFWDILHLDDLPYTGNYTGEWERASIPAGKAIHNRIGFTGTFEKDSTLNGEVISPVNHTGLFERDSGLLTDLISAVEQLPARVLQVDRVTWDNHRIDPVSPRLLEHQDEYYELIRGQVYAYLQNKDGLRSFRKYKPPSTRSDYYIAVGKFGVLRGTAPVVTAASVSYTMQLDEWAIGPHTAPSIFGEFQEGASVAGFSTPAALTSLAEFSGDTVITRNGFGVLRRLPGYFPGNGPWGLARRVSQDGHNTRVEHWKRPSIPVNATDAFDLPDHFLKYVRHYALWQAYNRRGPGQNPKMSAHYKARWQAGVARVLARIQAVRSAKLHRMGGAGGGQIVGSKPYARLPRNLPSS